MHAARPSANSEPQGMPHRVRDLRLITHYALRGHPCFSVSGCTFLRRRAAGHGGYGYCLWSPCVLVCWYSK